jgi:hypothetical protein
MRYKIVGAFLVLVISVSLGFNVYYYSVANSERVTVNEMRNYMVLSWGRVMYTASIYLADATTNVDVGRVGSLFYVAGENIAEAATYDTDKELYVKMVYTAMGVYDALSYADMYTNSTSSVRLINPASIEPIKTLASKIGYTAGLVIDEEAYLMNNIGVDPSQLLTEKGVLNQIMSGLDDIYNFIGQIHNFTNPV